MLNLHVYLSVQQTVLSTFFTHETKKRRKRQNMSLLYMYMYIYTLAIVSKKSKKQATAKCFISTRHKLLNNIDILQSPALAIKNWWPVWWSISFGKWNHPSMSCLIRARIMLPHMIISVNSCSNAIPQARLLGYALSWRRKILFPPHISQLFREI